jgi:hypothetical protein
MTLARTSSRASLTRFGSDESGLIERVGGGSFPPNTGHEHGRYAMSKTERRLLGEADIQCGDRERLALGRQPTGSYSGREWGLWRGRFPRAAILEPPPKPPLGLGPERSGISSGTRDRTRPRSVAAPDGMGAPLISGNSTGLGLHAKLHVHELISVSGGIFR